MTTAARIPWPEWVATHPEMAVTPTGTHHHASDPLDQFLLDVLWFLKFVWRHLHGIVVTLVAVAFTVGCVAGFVLDGEHFPAIVSGLIGLLSIAVGITYHSLGERRG